MTTLQAFLLGGLTATIFIFLLILTGLGQRGWPGPIRRTIGAMLGFPVPTTTMVRRITEPDADYRQPF